MPSLTKPNDRLVLIQREAEALAALNHPNIAGNINGGVS
jgi:hypothetical protein